MTRIVHLSDLHFGRDRPELYQPLLQAVNGAGADLVVLSGDLTQRARPAQFRAAQGFLAALNAPSLVVPGNHDVPLYNLALRLLTPFRRYRRAISHDLFPVRRLPGVLVIGINTVDPYRWQRGRIRRATLDRVCALAAADPAETVVVVAHHPFEDVPDSGKRLMRGAQRAVDRMAASGVGLVLSGHLHSWRAGHFIESHGGRRMLQIHAGTGLSSRLRAEPNDFARIDISGDDMCLERWAYDDAAGGFTPILHKRYRSDGAEWLGLGPSAGEPDMS
ncbi:metallophosphoesterase family protein [Actibacterium ureilyticum]|uniref:metallophosphoesterase family protein n=1 Tax=Actibacterium ureilyticum TaxID=1590614 RepID=UPI000BAAA0B3|nr:metallophosphoesterase [Actibacterium ureilyticum]